MTDRDHFAAAALTGLLYPEVDDEFAMPYIVGRAYLWADAMLRERCREGGDCPGQDNAPNYDAAPAARGDARECTAPVTTGGTRESLSGSLPADLGDGVSPSENDKNLHHTQEITAYRRFVGEVMNWIGEATGFLHDDVLRTDDARDAIHNACMRCWDAFDRISYPTIHGASPEARASGDSDRTDKAAPRPSEGTGDTPKPINACVSDRPQPINGPDPDSRVWETPVHTPPTHATPGEGSVPREGTQEPAAWGVLRVGCRWVSILETPEQAETSRQSWDRMENWVHEVIPLYRQPPCQDFSQQNLTLTDAEREAIRTAADAYAIRGTADGRESVNAAVLRGLLERLGGGR